jgi:hypothetical protein
MKFGEFLDHYGGELVCVSSERKEKIAINLSVLTSDSLHNFEFFQFKDRDNYTLNVYLDGNRNDALVGRNVEKLAFSKKITSNGASEWKIIRLNDEINNISLEMRRFSLLHFDLFESK